MNRVRISIDASPDEFGAEIEQIGNFIRILNDCYVDKEIYFFLSTNSNAHENANPYAGSQSGGLGGRQSEDALALAADLTLFLFGAKADANTEEALSAALNSYRKNGKPIVVTYFREMGGELQAEEIDDLQQRLSREPDYYYHMFSHIDTFKLGVLMNIKRLDLNGVDIRLDNGKAWQGGEVLLSLENVEMVSGYEDLELLKTERASLEGAFYEARTKYAENPEDKVLYEAYVEASNRRNRAIQEIRGIESRLYNMIEGMYEQTAQGRVSKRQVEGYKLIERGMLQEARTVLNFDEIVSESRHDEEIAEQAAKRAQVHVQELMQLKDVNETLHDWESVDDCFREAVRLEAKHNLRRKATIEYLRFLTMQQRTTDGVELAENLLSDFRSMDALGPDDDKAQLYQFIGMYYEEMNRYTEAEEAFKTSVDIRKRAAGDNGIPDVKIVASYNSLANLYDSIGQLEKSIEAHRLCNETIKKIMESYTSFQIRLALAANYINFSDTYGMAGMYDEAIELLTEGADYCERLVADNPGDLVCKFYLATFYETFAYTYVGVKRYKEAEELYISTEKVFTELAGENPDAYESKLAVLHIDFGKMYFDTKRYSQAEEKYIAAHAFYSKSIALGVNFSIRSYAYCLKSLGELYVETSRYAEAEEVYDASLLILEEHKETNPDFEEKIQEFRGLIDSARAAKLKPEQGSTQFTPAEQEVALLLTEGRSRTEITNKLRLSASELSAIVRSIREKISPSGDASPVIDAVAAKYKLTKREADMLHYLKLDAGNEIIAAELFLSEETVRIHVRNVIKKLSIENRKDVSAWMEEYASKMTF